MILLRAINYFRLLHQIKDAPTNVDQIGHKVQAANDVVQSIKQLRKEIVEIMSQLLFLAKSKNPKGMLPLCNEMMGKTRALLNIWEPNIVEEAFQFIEKNRIIDEPDNQLLAPLSPFKKITQQLGALNLKSPELEDFATPMGPYPDLWPNQKKSMAKSPSMQHLKTKSPSTTDINAITTVHSSVQFFNQAIKSNKYASSSDKMSTSLPPILGVEASESELKFSETHFDVNGEISTSVCEHTETQPAQEATETPTSSTCASMTSDQLLENKTELLSSLYDENGYLIENTAICLGHNGAFFDTKTMSSSDYYRPTEEPEPLDLTQLNVEASVMCLVSKVKFLCGRCGSPAVRLRQPRNASLKRGFNSLPPDVAITSQPTVSTESSENSATPTNGSKNACTNLNLALTQAVGEVTRKVKKGNKFTDGLDLSLTTDWGSELRPSMKKLRQAMDGLLKTARLMHSVQRLQYDMKKVSSQLAIQYRRDVCFSQAVSIFDIS